MLADARPPRTGRPVGALLLAAALASCGGDSTAPPPALASITVTAPVGAVLARGAVVALSADRRDTEGNPHAAPLEWSSSNTAVATVTSMGVVTAVGPGTAMIEARSGTVAGEIEFTVLDVDREAIAALLDDPFTATLVAAAGTAGGDPGAALGEAESALEAGDVLAARAALESIGPMASSATDPDRRAVLAVLELITDRALAHLGV